MPSPTSGRLRRPAGLPDCPFLKRVSLGGCCEPVPKTIALFASFIDSSDRLGFSPPLRFSSFDTFTHFPPSSGHTTCSPRGGALRLLPHTGVHHSRASRASPYTLPTV